MLYCDRYSAYRILEEVILICCLAHSRWRFYKTVPKEQRKKLKLLDINSEREMSEPMEGTALDGTLLPTEKGVAFCNQLFYLERLYKDLPTEERKQKR
ncbi:MAG: transposase [Hungatella sp.]|jgi:transposase|nr:transposase [Hungatella sp.]